MFGFFDKGSSWTQGMQLYNVTIISLAAYSLVTNPEGKVAELGLALVTHAYSMYSLNETNGFGTRILGAGANLFRMGAIYAGITSGCSNASWALQAMCACGNLLNMGTLLFDDKSEDDGAKPASKLN
ncbi:hypothetical protein [Legionella quateirensis]|uniref:Uncharacterized protein n=1 Tax=Legionella quateirensis TaxID=45072 RepID=A0A378KU35_9GAMM|nr:hypothetical protein [Legionella quateirensis]KTD42424.1 hypothetical protein Lqua_3402 [Legionella quateirensis]STY17121.1 Uncharacterised protein [Legionella quateirensis]